jgi:hypothetical protein
MVLRSFGRGRPLNAPAAFHPSISRSSPLSRLVAHQRSNQSQEFLLFWPIVNGKKKSSDLNISGLTA